MKAIANDAHRDDIRGYCRSIVAEAVSGGQRYPTMLEYHRQSHHLVPRQTTFQLIELYGQLVSNDAQSRATACECLHRYYPDDLDAYLEREGPVPA